MNQDDAEKIMNRQDPRSARYWRGNDQELVDDVNRAMGSVIEVYTRGGPNPWVKASELFKGGNIEVLTNGSPPWTTIDQLSRAPGNLEVRVNNSEKPWLPASEVLAAAA